MKQENIYSIYKLLDNMTVTDENKDTIYEIKKCLDNDNYMQALVILQRRTL